MSSTEKLPNEFYISLLATSAEREAMLDELHRLPAKLSKILSTIRTFPQSKIFLTRVSRKEAPNYYTIIKRPMDLGTVKRKMGMYRSYAEFRADLDLIWNNCLAYNEGRYYRDCAMKMRELVNTLEIEKVPVEKAKELPWCGEPCEGREYYGGTVRHMIRKFCMEMLRKVGFCSASKAAIDVLVDVVRRRLHGIAKDVSEESSVNEMPASNERASMMPR
jgi:hypothetical protein